MRNCIDCQKEIKNKKAIRCPNCYYIFRRSIVHRTVRCCIDCKKEVHNYYAKRCLSCNYVSKRGLCSNSGKKAWQTRLSRGGGISIEHRQKIADANRGQKRSEESRLRMSIAKKGMRISPLTEFTRERVFGANNVNWKGGTSTVNDKARHNKEMILWRKACLERDNWTCQKSGQKGGQLEVHHINNFSEYPELRTSIENGITLSRQAHLYFHKKYGFKNNTKEQLKEFLSETVSNVSSYFQELISNKK